MGTLPIELQGARVGLLQQRPYFASVLYRMPVKESTLVPTMGVDKHWRLYYNPEFIKRLRSQELVGVLYHEIAHLLRNHAGRAEAYVPPTNSHRMLWNLAGDMEINQSLHKEGFTLPEGGVFPESVGMDGGLLAEEYYDLLLKKAEELAQSGNAPGDMEEGENDGEGGGQSGGRGEGETKEGELAKRLVRPDQAAAGRCGSGAGGVEEEWEEKGEAVPGEKVNAVEAEILRRDVAEKVKQEMQRGRGTVPGWLEQWAEEILNPKVPWQKVLKAAVREGVRYVAGVVDYTYTRPSRRKVEPFVLPALRSPVPSIAIVLDTSGSMSGLLEQALGEVKGVLKASGAIDGVHVLCTDAAVASTQKVFSPKQISLQGGGGTDMRIGMEAAEKMKPDLLIVLSDGETPWPDNPPKGVKKTVIALIGDSQRGGIPEYVKSRVPTWAKVVEAEI